MGVNLEERRRGGCVLPVLGVGMLVLGIGELMGVIEERRGRGCILPVLGMGGLEG